MRAVPAGWTDAALCGHLREVYGLDTKTLTFVPKGDVAWGWIGSDGDGPRVFAKLYDAEREDHRTKAARSSDVLRALRDGDWLGNVPEPIATLDGSFESRLEGWLVTVQSYIAGESFGGRPLTRDAAMQIGETAARLHLATADVVAATGIEADSPGQPMDLVGFLNAHRHELAAEAPGATGHLDAVAERLAELESAVAPRGASDVVLIHGDMAHDNVLMDESGSLGVVDWDDARLAQREMELAMTAWLAAPVFPALARAYVDTSVGFGADPPALDVDAMELQAWRYNIGSIWFYLQRLAEPDLAAQQAESDRALLRWVVEEWQVTTQRFDAAAEALAAAGVLLPTGDRRRGQG